MRLDKFVTSTGILSRSECGKAARAGRILLNGTAVKTAAVQVDPETDTILLDGSPLTYCHFTYVMLNKPDGYVSATEDGKDPTVLTLLPKELQKRDLFPCGRLDKHTTGLMLITDDGQLGHKLLSPKRHVSKTYAFTSKFPLSAEDLERLTSGVDIETKDGGSYRTKPAILQMTTPTTGEITITEGKYHQIKFMLMAVHNQITSLQRVTFGPISLDPSLAPGEWRSLTEEEIASLQKAVEV